MDTPAPPFTEQELAEFLRMPRETIRQWRKNRVNKAAAAEQGPDFTKAGRAVRYRRDDVMAWLEANTNRRDVA